MVGALTEAEPLLTPTQVTSVREAVKGATDEVLAPLFEEPLRLRLVDGPVATTYSTRLGNWDPTVPQEPIDSAIARLQAATDAGWSDPEALRTIASQAAGQLAEVPDDVVAERSLMGILKLLRKAPPGDEVDQLATSLVESPGEVDPPSRMAACLELPVSAGAQAEINTGLVNWLEAVQPEFAEVLLTRGRKTLEAIGFDPRAVLMARWEASEGRRWAELGYEFDAGRDATLLAASLARTDDSTLAPFASEAAGIIEAKPRKAAARALVEELARRAQTLVSSAIGALAPPLLSLSRVGASLDPFVSTLRDRIADEPAIGDLTHAVRVLHDAGIKSVRPLAKGLAARGSAAGGIALADVDWVIRSSGGTNEARHVLVRAIETAPVPEVRPIVDAVVETLRHHREVRVALVNRAASGVSEDDATALLRSARPWQPPRGPDVASYHQALTTIATQFPNTTGLVNDLQ
jgi:hypothetical protein